MSTDFCNLFDFLRYRKCKLCVLTTNLNLAVVCSFNDFSICLFYIYIFFYISISFSLGLVTPESQCG